MKFSELTREWAPSTTLDPSFVLTLKTCVRTFNVSIIAQTMVTARKGNVTAIQATSERTAANTTVKPSSGVVTSHAQMEGIAPRGSVDSSAAVPLATLVRSARAHYKLHPANMKTAADMESVTMGMTGSQQCVGVMLDTLERSVRMPLTTVLCPQILARTEVPARAHLRATDVFVGSSTVECIVECIALPVQSSPASTGAIVR